MHALRAKNVLFSREWAIVFEKGKDCEAGSFFEGGVGGARFVLVIPNLWFERRQFVKKDNSFGKNHPWLNILPTRYCYRIWQRMKFSDTIFPIILWYSFEDFTKSCCHGRYSFIPKLPSCELFLFILSTLVVDASDEARSMLHLKAWNFVHGWRRSLWQLITEQCTSVSVWTRTSRTLEYCNQTLAFNHIWILSGKFKF